MMPNWKCDLQWQEVSRPLKSVEGEDIYTLYIEDFLRLPDVNYGELAALDPHVQALLN